MPLKTTVGPSAVPPVSVNDVTVRRLIVTAVCVCVAGPAFALDILPEPRAAAGGMVWLGLAGLAIAGSPRKRGREQARGPADR